MALQGNLQDMTVADLIQHNCQDRKTARLIIEQNGQQATLFFKDGAIPHATLDELEGEEVIYRTLNWHDGQFTLEAGLEPETVTITRSWSGLLLKGAQRLDEIQQQPSTFTSEKEHHPMANINDTLAAIMKLDGTIAAALVDWSSGMTLGTIGSNSKFDIDIAAAGNTNVVRSKLDVMKDLKLKGAIEDILITLSEQYHLIRPLSSNPNLFIYVALSRAKSNLGLARHKLAEIEKDLSV
jgi:hypothetical protein